MQPDNISSSPPSTPRAAWRDHAPIFHAHRVYKVEELYGCGLQGLLHEQSADELSVTPAALHAALEENPVLEQAYDAGWDRWEKESLRRTEVALARSAEGYVESVKKVNVNKGILTRYEEEVSYPPNPTALTFKLERRDRERFGKDVRVEPPSVGNAVLEQVSLYLLGKGLGAVEGLPPAAPQQTPAASPPDATGDW